MTNITNNSTSNGLLLEPIDNKRLSNLCGPFDKHLRQIENFLGVEINSRGNNFYVSGKPKLIGITEGLLKEMYDVTKTESLTAEAIHLHLNSLNLSNEIDNEYLDEISIKTKRGLIRGRTNNQKEYLFQYVEEAMASNQMKKSIENRIKYFGNKTDIISINKVKEMLIAELE